MEECIFCKIAAGEISTQRIADSKFGMVFPDINPQAPIHLLAIPKVHLASLNDVGPEHGEMIAGLFHLIETVAEDLEFAEDGYRVIANVNEDAGQEVFHLHFHVLAGTNLGRIVSPNLGKGKKG